MKCAGKDLTVLNQLRCQVEEKKIFFNVPDNKAHNIETEHLLTTSWAAPWNNAQEP